VLGSYTAIRTDRVEKYLPSKPLDYLKPLSPKYPSFAKSQTHTLCVCRQKERERRDWEAGGLRRAVTSGEASPPSPVIHIIYPLPSSLFFAIFGSGGGGFVNRKWGGGLEPQIGGSGEGFGGLRWRKDEGWLSDGSGG
jgi:hypothetical protein